MTAPSAPQVSSFFRRHWWVLLLAAAAGIVRFQLIRKHDFGGYDLDIYRYFGSIVLSGGNPYHAPAGGPIKPSYADMSPANLASFAAILSLRNSPNTIRYAFACIDVLIVCMLAVYPKRPLSWRAAVAIFYAFNPMVLASFVIVCEDKVVVFALVLLLFVALDLQSRVGALAATIALAIYKWMGVFFIIPLSLYFARHRRDLALYVGAFALAFALSHVPYFPSNLLTYKYRDARMLLPPTHSSIDIVLAKAGIYPADRLQNRVSGFPLLYTSAVSA